MQSLFSLLQMFNDFVEMKMMQESEDTFTTVIKDRLIPEFQVLQKNCFESEKIYNECRRFRILYLTDSYFKSCNWDFYDLCSELCTQIVAFMNKYRENTKPHKGVCIITERAKKYFSRAIDAGFMTETDTGYKWISGGNRGKVRLAYFLHQIYNPEGVESIPYKQLEALFGVNRLDSSVDGALNTKRPQGWRKEIESKIFYD